MDFILAQIFGGIALILVCIGYFLKSKSGFLIIQVVADFFYALAFFVVDAFVAGVITIISLFRCVYLYFAEKKHFKNTTYFLFVFVGLYIITTFIFTPFKIILYPISYW